MADNTALVPISTVISSLYEGLTGKKTEKDATHELRQLAVSIKNAGERTSMQKCSEAKLLLIISHHWHRIQR